MDVSQMTSQIDVLWESSFGRRHLLAFRAVIWETSIRDVIWEMFIRDVVSILAPAPGLKKSGLRSVLSARRSK